jgi:CHAT domain-containing protein/predicted negative regulator of RcsB-dependent stress response
MTRHIQKIGIIPSLLIILLIGAVGSGDILDRAAAENPPTDFQQSGDHANHIQALIYLSRALAEMGKNQQAQLHLQMAVQTAQTHHFPHLMAQAMGQLGVLHIKAGEAEPALAILQEGLKISRDIQDRPLVATFLNDLGNAHVLLKNPSAAIAAYTEASILADSLDLQSLSIRAMVNASLVELKTGAIPNATLRLEQAWDKTKNLPDSHEKIQNFLTIGQGLREISHKDIENRASLFSKASEALQNGIHSAKAIGDWKQESYGWGFLAELYEEEGRPREALKLTQLAIRASQQGEAPEGLYLWEWKAGRYLKQLGQLDEAILAYQQAIDTLQPIRQELVAGLPTHPTAFRESIGALFFEMAEALLERETQLTEDTQREKLLYQTRDTIEAFKAAELQDYFKDDCVEVNQARIQPIDRIASNTAIIYPIIFADRTDMLVSLSGTIKRITVPVTEKAVTQRIEEFRTLLEKRTTHQYLPHAQSLYTLLIQPLEPYLKEFNIHTLVFVPDGALRTIPMAALHDGERFLIQKYAIAITPGITLTDARSLDQEHVHLLSIGLSEGVLGFSPLPNVQQEIQELHDLFGGTSLLNKEFLAGNIERKMKEENFTVVHIASHGKFDQNPQDSFVLTYDEKLSIDQLSKLIGMFQFRQTPLDLLTLSACETAVGDERSALGLAGVAVKSGARSALGTLWFINDQASSILVHHFYTHLKQAGLSKAQALQKAQLSLLDHPIYRHPGYWAPFLLINNWL